MARLVIADTGPINYLILINCIDLLPTLFDKVVLPEIVRAELSAPNAPPSVRGWIFELPPWLEVRKATVKNEPDYDLKDIHAGEHATISLETALEADLVLMDDRKGVILARKKGLRVTTLGVLEFAAFNGLIDFSAAIDRLRQTNFRSPTTLLDALLRRHSKDYRA